MSLEEGRAASRTMVPRPPGMTGFGLGQGRHGEVRKHIGTYADAAALWKIKSTWVASLVGV